MGEVGTKVGSCWWELGGVLWEGKLSLYQISLPVAPFRGEYFSGRFKGIVQPSQGKEVGGRGKDEKYSVLDVALTLSTKMKSSVRLQFTCVFR